MHNKHEAKSALSVLSSRKNRISKWPMKYLLITGRITKRERRKRRKTHTHAQCEVMKSFPSYVHIIIRNNQTHLPRTSSCMCYMYDGMWTQNIRVFGPDREYILLMPRSKSLFDFIHFQLLILCVCVRAMRAYVMIFHMAFINFINVIDHFSNILIASHK